MDDPLIFTVLAALALVGTSLFIWRFVREPWRRTEFGRSLMAMAVGVWLFALVSTLRQIFGPEYFARQEIRVVAYVLIVYAVYARTFTLWRMQRDKSAVPHPRRRSTDIPRTKES